MQIRVVEVDPNTLKVDHEYQAPLDEKRVDTIVRAGWDENLAQTIEVSARNGSWYVMEGQHRVVAARRLGIPRLSARVHEGLSVEDEARIFVGTNTMRRRPNTAATFRARLRQGDPRAVLVASICEEFAVHLRLSGTGNRSPRSTRAFAALENILDYEAALLRQTLRICMASWPEDDRALDQTPLYGVASFLYVYGAHPRFREKELVEKLASHPAIWVVQRSGVWSSGSPGGGGSGRLTLKSFNKAGPRMAVLEAWNFRRQLPLPLASLSDMKTLAQGRNPWADA